MFDKPAVTAELVNPGYFNLPDGYNWSLFRLCSCLDRDHSHKEAAAA